jgi:hypothetical protein
MSRSRLLTSASRLAAYEISPGSGVFAMTSDALAATSKAGESMSAEFFAVVSASSMS